MTTNQPEQAAGADQPRSVAIGRYELVTQLVNGPLGELWKARIASGPEIGRFVALRRLLRTPEVDAAVVDRIAKGGFTAMELRHPRVTAMLDVVVADAEIAAVSEHIGGTFLQSLFRPATPLGKRPSVPVPVATRIAIDILEALNGAQAAWAEMFPSVESDEDRFLAAGVSGGLLPDTVLIASFGETLLHEAGFSGVALAMPSFLSHPDSLAYRAPEQLGAAASASTVDVRADVFTVGIILWELIAARALFGPALLPRPASAPSAKAKQVADALQASSIRHKVLTLAIPRLDTLPLLRGKVSKELAACVAKCLERDPSARFQSPDEALAAFQALGPNTVAPHADVASFIASTVAPETVSEEGPDSGAIESNRPTEPPVGKRETPPPETTRGPTADREVVQAVGPSSVPSSIEAAISNVGATVPNSDLDAPAAALESTPAAPPADSLQAETSAPSELVPSETPSVASASPVVPVEAQSEEVEELAAVDSVPPESIDAEPLPVSNPEPPPATEVRGAATTTASFPFVAQHAARPAPVVRPADEFEPPAGLHDRELAVADRRARNQKLVIRVVAVAGVLSIVALIQAVRSKSNDASPATTSAPAATLAPPSAGSPGKGEPDQAPVPADAPAAPTTDLRAAPPTSSLSPTQPVASGAPNVVKKPKKKPFRPTGI